MTAANLALVVLALVLCAAAPAAANRPFMMGSNSWISSEIARVSRSLQVWSLLVPPSAAVSDGGSWCVLAPIV